MAIIALIPAYDPDAKLVELVDQLKEHDFDIVIVNDGSGPAFAFFVGVRVHIYRRRIQSQVDLKNHAGR